jgi:hypothetical protein
MRDFGMHNSWFSGNWGNGSWSGGGSWSPDDGVNFGTPGGGDGTLFAFGSSDDGTVPRLQQSLAGTTPATVTGTVAKAGTLPVEPASPTAFTIDINWDSSVSSAPSGFTSDILAVAKYLETEFTNAATITIDVGYQEVDGNTIGSGDLGESLANFTSATYANLLGAVKAKSSLSATAASVASELPATSPVSGATYWLSTAQSKALGLTASNTSVDGYVGFGASSLFTYGDTATTGTVASGTYDFFATAIHEITEDMGRQLLDGETFGGVANSDSLLDLLHYSASGTRDFATNSGYFSINGGATNLGTFNTVAGGDDGDWSSVVTNDPFDSFATSGVLEKVSANDLTEVNAIGWNLAGSTPVNKSQPTGVTITAATASLAAGQGSTGLTAKTPLAHFAQVGGSTTDTYSYTLGGSGDASFALTTASNVATLAVGSSTATGAAAGKLYALTVTAKDTNSGNSAPAQAINVVVGSGGNDTITLSSLSGIATSAPTFIYGLAGNDTVKGTGITGKITFDAGAGADTLTGGTGGNDYEFGAAADSTSTAMDIITNFNVKLDLIDLTGIATKLSYAGAIASTATTLAADSIGFQGSGGNTFVYVNDTSASARLTATSGMMKIELTGTVALTTANFAHS